MKEYIMRYENEVLQLLPDKIQPLVRCKDCKCYWEEAHECQNLGVGAIKPDFFCAYANRKEGDGE